MSENGTSAKTRLKLAHQRFRSKQSEQKAKCPEGSGPSTVRVVPLAEVDLADDRFQWRLNVSHGDLRKSLEKEGQLVPVVLWGKQQPYKVIDGFRRLICAQELGWSKCEAIVRADLTEDEAFKLSFIENVKRRNLSSVDR